MLLSFVLFKLKMGDLTPKKSMLYKTIDLLWAKKREANKNKLYVDTYLIIITKFLRKKQIKHYKPVL